MVPVRDLFESHLLVGDLTRSMAFRRGCGTVPPTLSRIAAWRSIGSVGEDARCSACGKWGLPLRD